MHKKMIVVAIKTMLIVMCHSNSNLSNKWCLTCSNSNNNKDNK